MKLKVLLLALPLALAFASCQKQIKGDEDVQPVGAPSPVEIRFEHTVAKYSDLVLDSSYPVPMPAPALLGFFTVTDFKYYISNIELISSNTGDTIKIPNTYFLVDHKKPLSQKLQFSAPADEYYAMSFMIGIDHAKNSTGPHTGALDPSLGMFWNTTDGYIMGLLEGTSTGSSRPDKTFSWHIGGTKAPYSVLSRRYFKLGGNASIDPSKKTVINMQADVKKWFTEPNGHDLAGNPVINAPGQAAYKISQNYYTMFDFVSVKYE